MLQFSEGAVAHGQAKEAIAIPIESRLFRLFMGMDRHSVESNLEWTFERDQNACAVEGG